MDTGNLGEYIFGKWCHQVDLNPNKVPVDKDGFDFIVSLPKTFDDNLKTLDQDNSHSQILVQVKATKTEKGNRSIKLSNLKKLVDSPLPAFYLLILVSEEGESISAHLFHVWEKIIYVVQKKLRAVPKDKWGNLNEIFVTLPWKSAQEFEELNGRALYKLINNNLTTTNSAIEYAKQKEKIRETVGYEKEKDSLQFQSKLPDKYEGDLDDFMVDLYLGEIDKVDLLDFEMIDKRFGEEIVVKKEEGGHFKILNIEPEGQAKLKFHTADFRSAVEFTTDLYVPRGIGQIVKDEKKWKILYKAPLIKFFVYLESSKINFEFDLPDFTKKAKLSELVDISNLMLFLSEIENEERVLIEIIKEDKLFMDGSLGFSKFTEQIPIEYFRSIKYTNRLLNSLDIKNDLNIKPIELKAQLGVLEYINELLAPKPLYMNLEFWVATDLKNYSKTICLMPFSITIGDYIIPIEVKVEGNPDKTGEVEGENIFYGLKSNNVRIEQHRVLKREKADLKKTYKKMKEKSLKKYDISDDVMVIHLDPDAGNES